MKKRLIITCTFLLALSVQILAKSPLPVHADDAVTSPKDSNAGLCLPNQDGSYSTQGCLMEGPARQIEELAQSGITFPEAPLYITTAPAELGTVPFTYAQLSNDVVLTYDTAEDVRNNHPTGKLPASKIKYVSLYNKMETDKGEFWQIANQKWISRESLTVKGVQFFQGYEFVENPTVPFGWILDETKSRTGPSMASPETGNLYHRYNVVHTYDSVKDNDIEWVRIGPEEWVNHRSLARVIPNNDKPKDVTADRWIEINLYEQVMLVHEGDKVVFVTLVATGVDPFFTQPGVFKIYKKIDHEYMRGAFEADRSDYYYLEDVPYIMYFDQSRALHGAYWHTLFGYQRSHGCVNLSIADSHWLFDWANIGDFVYVWVPSGKTPTDPSFYGAGGA